MRFFNYNLSNRKQEQKGDRVYEKSIIIQGKMLLKKCKCKY